MKAFSIAVAVTLVLAFVCVQIGSAVPLQAVQELEEAGGKHTPVAAHQTMSVESWMESLGRQKRHIAHLPICYWGCNCKAKKGCGVCCT